jgi:hypothetical protein
MSAVSDLLHQMKRASDIGVDHLHYFGEVLIEKGLAQPSAGIGPERVGRPVRAFRCGIELVDPVDLRRDRPLRLRP